MLQHQRLRQPPGHQGNVISTAAGATPASAPAAAGAGTVSVPLPATAGGLSGVARQEAPLPGRRGRGLGADHRRGAVQEEGGASDRTGGGVDGDGLAVLGVAAAEQRADADVPAAHGHGGEEAADGLRRGGGWRRRGCQCHGRPQAAAPPLAPFSFTHDTCNCKASELRSCLFTGSFNMPGNMMIDEVVPKLYFTNGLCVVLYVY